MKQSITSHRGLAFRSLPVEGEVNRQSRRAGICVLFAGLCGCAGDPIHCESLAPSGKSKIIVTRRGSSIDFRVRVLLQNGPRLETLFDDALDRVPGACLILWSADSRRVSVHVEDLAGAIDFGYDVAERRVLDAVEKDALRRRAHRRQIYRLTCWPILSSTTGTRSRWVASLKRSIGSVRGSRLN